MGIVINRTSGGLGRQALGNDYISGLVFQNSTALLSGAVQKVTTLAEAEALGVTVAAYPIEHYHISEYFAIAESILGLAQGVLYFMIKNIITTTYDATELVTLQNAASGDIKQAGVFLTDPFLSSMVTDTQTQCTVLKTANRPLSVLLAADMTALTVATIADMRALDSENVTTVLGEDADGTGGALAVSESTSITILGVSLGCLAQAAVHESIAWRQKFNIVNGSEYEVLNFATGEAYADQSGATITALTTKGYLFAVKEDGYNGSFHNASPTSTAITSDFATINLNRTIDKAARLIRINYIPKISAPLYTNAATGKVSEATISEFKNLAITALETMATAGEISVDDNGNLPVNSVIIDPEQDVLSTSEIEITVKIVPVGVAEAITINIGYTVSVT